MARTGGYEPNRSFARELRHSEQILPLLDGTTRAVAARAQVLAAERSRTIAAAIVYEVGMTPDGWTGRVNAFDFKSGWAEFGTSRFPQVRMLGRSLEEIVGPVAGD